LQERHAQEMRDLDTRNDEERDRYIREHQEAQGLRRPHLDDLQTGAGTGRPSQEGRARLFGRLRQHHHETPRLPARGSAFSGVQDFRGSAPAPRGVTTPTTPLVSSPARRPPSARPDGVDSGLLPCQSSPPLTASEMPLP
jgi:hypothetical protein